MREEHVTVLFLLGGAALIFLLMNNNHQQAQPSMLPLMANSEDYEWIDYRGKKRTLTVHREVKGVQ